MNAITQYDRARAEVKLCATVDEAKQFKDKAQALHFYARQRDDVEFKVWTKEIYERACMQFGLLSGDLEKAEHGGAGGGSKIPAVGRSKSDVLAEIGVSTSAAQRYEELAGGPTEQGRAAAEAASERYFAQARAEQKPATREGLRGAIREALTETLGPPPDRSKVTAFRRKPDPTADALADFAGAVRTIAELPEPDMTKLAVRVQEELVDWYRDNCREARSRLGQFVTALTKGGKHAA